jgi:hypothetical protein
MESSEKKPLEATAVGKLRLATDCTGLTAVQKAVLIQLALHCFEHPTTTAIGAAKIAVNTCFKERAVREALKTLSDPEIGPGFSLITIIHRPSPLTSLKRIDWDALKAKRRVDPGQDWKAEHAGHENGDASEVDSMTIDEKKAFWERQRAARIARRRVEEVESDSSETSPN